MCQINDDLASLDDKLDFARVNRTVGSECPAEGLARFEGGLIDARFVDRSGDSIGCAAAIASLGGGSHEASASSKSGESSGDRAELDVARACLNVVSAFARLGESGLAHAALNVGIDANTLAKAISWTIVSSATSFSGVPSAWSVFLRSALA